MIDHNRTHFQAFKMQTTNRLDMPARHKTIDESTGVCALIDETIDHRSDHAHRMQHRNRSRIGRMGQCQCIEFIKGWKIICYRPDGSVRECLMTYRGARRRSNRGPLWRSAQRLLIVLFNCLDLGLDSFSDTLPDLSKGIS